MADAASGEGSISALPRQPAWGLASDLLAKIKAIAEAMPTSPSAQLVNMLIGNKAKMADDAAYGFPPTQGTGETLGPKPEYAADVADLIPWTAAANAGRKVAGALARKVGESPWQIAGSPAAQAGVLRLGGNPDLMYSHGLSKGLEDPQTGETLKELLHPSLAMTGGATHRNDFGREGLLIPKPGAFDPTYSASSAFNRDAYLARAENFPGGTNPGPATRAGIMGLLPQAKTESMGYHSWSKLGGSGFRQADDSLLAPWINNAHDAAIFSSPAFRSFMEFEKGKGGAGVLGARLNDVTDWSNSASEDMRNWLKPQGLMPSGTNWLTSLRTKAAEGDKEAQRLLTSFRTAPSEYGELKVSGAVPITGNRWAGAILPKNQYSKHATTLESRGIPTTEISYTDSRDFDLIHRMASEMQAAAGPVKERSLRVRAGWAPGQDVPPLEIRIEGKQGGGPSSRPDYDPSWAKQFDSKEDAMKAAEAKQPALKAGGAVNFDDLHKTATAFKPEGEGGTPFGLKGQNYKVFSDGNVYEADKDGLAMGEVVMNLSKYKPTAAVPPVSKQTFHPSFKKAAQEAVDSVPEMDYGVGFEYNGAHFSISPEGDVTQQGKHGVILNLLEDVAQ